jgi:hypothetical protein
MIGRWAASQTGDHSRFQRSGARLHIEKSFDAAVMEILNPFELADLRVLVLQGDDTAPPAIAIVCDTIGQIELGWIEKDNVLRNTMVRRVAPVSWQAAAYKALELTLPCALPIFNYANLFEEISAYWWDGETEDLPAIKAMVDMLGAELDDIDQDMLPSTMNARRPEWMLAKNAGAMKHLPTGLRQKIRALHDAHKAVNAIGETGNAWNFDFQMGCDYLTHLEDCSHLPAMTLVCADHFARELDDVGRHGMEQGFMDIAGICQLPDVDHVDRWFASLQIGAEFLLAAQDLINLDIDKL